MATQDVNLESLKKDIDSLKSEFKDVIKSLKDLGASSMNQAQSAKDKILDQLSTEELKKYIDDLKLKGKDSLDNVNDTIKQDPLKSVAIAAGVGFLFAWLIKR